MAQITELSPMGVPMAMHGSFAGKTIAPAELEGTPVEGLRRYGETDQALRRWEKTTGTLRRTGAADEALRKT